MKSLSFLLVLAITLTGCGSFSSSQAVSGGLIGGATGVGAGALFGSSEQAVGAGLAGAGIGMIAGALANDLEQDRIRDPKTSTKVIRLPEYDELSDRQMEIDKIASEVHEAGKMGRSESKSWNERYWDENQNIPYQGNVSSQVPY